MDRRVIWSEAICPVRAVHGSPTGWGAASRDVVQQCATRGPKEHRRGAPRRGSVLHVIGGGGHASVVVDVARRAGISAVTVWSDDPPHAARFHPGTAFRPLSQLDRSLPVTLGLGDLTVRARLRERFPTFAEAVIDPSAVIGHGVVIGKGVVVFAASVLNANV